MDAIFASLVLGHLVGDYLLQTEKMARLKTEKTWRGFWYSIVHAVIYTLSVCVFLGNFSWIALSAIFLSHWPLDRYSWGEKWLYLMGGRRYMETYKKKEPFWEIHTCIGCLVYVVVDNTWHLVLMFLAAKYFF